MSRFRDWAVVIGAVAAIGAVGRIVEPLELSEPRLDDRIAAVLQQHYCPAGQVAFVGFDGKQICGWEI